MSESTRSYWAMRTDRQNSALIYEELRRGRLRQGWGYDASQDLRLVAEKRRRDEPLSETEIEAWRHWRMMGGTGGIQPGDVVLVPNLPNPGEVLFVEVAGPYRFERLELRGDRDVNGLGWDYGHILPVRRSEKPVVVPMQHPRLHAGLKRSLTCRSRLWSLEDFGDNIAGILVDPPDGGHDWHVEDGVDVLVERVRAGIEDAAERQLDALLEQGFAGADFEVPCVRLLERVFPGARVERTAGPAERGADIVVTWDDPLAEAAGASALSWRVVVQVKSWRGVAADTGAVDQLVLAREAYGSDGYPVRAAFLLTLCDGEAPGFAERRAAARVNHIGRRRLLALLRDYLVVASP